MRSFACRRLGSLALALGRGQADSTIAQATFTLSHHGGQCAHAAPSCARAADGDVRLRMISSRPQPTGCCGPAGGNVRPSTKTSGLAGLRLFARRGKGVEPVGAADALGWPNSRDAREGRPAMPDARDDMALTHDRGRMVMAPAACADARAAVPGRIFDQPNSRDLSVHQGSLRARQETSWRAAAKEPGAGELAARQFAAAASPLPRGRRRKPPRCLKPPATSLEAIGGRDSCAERRGRREPGAASASGQGAFRRGAADHGCWSMQRKWALCFVGAA